MELYIGGCYQGKLSYVLSRKNPGEGIVADGASCSFQECGRAAVLNHLHLLVRRLLKGEFAQELALSDESGLTEVFQELLRKNPGLLIICDEIGSGIVPLAKEERDYREQTGRLLCFLAAQASHVERIVCGLGQVLKDDRTQVET